MDKSDDKEEKKEKKEADAGHQSTNINNDYIYFQLFMLHFNT